MPITPGIRSQKGTMLSQKKSIRSCVKVKYMMPFLELNSGFALRSTLDQLAEQVEPERNRHNHDDEGDEFD